MAVLFDPLFQAVNASGAPYAGARLNFYRSGTTSRVTVYKNAQGSTPHTNPVIADSAGMFAPIYLDTVYPLKAILQSAAGVTIMTIDRFDPAPGGVTGNSYTVETSADLPVPSNEFAEGIVLNDPDPAKNGIWYRGGAAWVKGRSLPDTLARMTVTGGTSDAIAASALPGVDPASVAMLWIEALSTNTGAVTINGKPVKTIDDADLIAGQWLAGRTYWFTDEGAHYKLRTESDVSGLVAEAEAAATAALAAQQAAEQAAAGAGVSDGDKGDVIVSGGGAVWAVKTAPAPQGRLSLVSGIPVSASDVTGATSIYYVPAVGAHVPIFDGTAFRARSIGAQLTHVLDNNTGHALYQAAGGVYDEWLFWDGSAVKLGNGPSWAAGAVAGSTTARGTGAGSTELEMHQGFLVNKNSMQVRWGAGAGDITSVPARQATFVGSFAPPANGQAADTRESRLLFNAHNQTIRSLRRQDPSPSWPYVSSTVRQANGNVANQVSVLLGLSGVFAAVRATAVAYAASSTIRTVGTYISLDGVDVPEDAAGGIFSTTGVTAQTTGICEYQGCPGLGYRAFKWLEFGSTDITFVGTPASPYTRTGITGHVVM